jgi:hypothetical protein
MVAFNPEISYFKPRGIPMIDLEEVCLTVDQREAIRLSKPSTSKVAAIGFLTRRDCFNASTAILSGRNRSAAADPSTALRVKKMNFTALGKNAGKRNNPEY